MKHRMPILFLSTLLTVGATGENPGKDMFVSKCAICHSADGSAQTPIAQKWKLRSLHSPEIQKQSDAELKMLIKNGKNKMPLFNAKLSDEQIDQVIAYIRELDKQK